MRASRLFTLTLIALLLAASLPARADLSPGVRGGGYIRDQDKTKTTLTISGSDGGPLGDSGQAQLVRHKPGSAANAVHITLMCVHVTGSIAIASGFGDDNKIYLIVIKDNGQGSEKDEFGVVEQITAFNYCAAGLVPSDGIMGTANGGNFQVTP